MSTILNLVLVQLAEGVPGGCRVVGRRCSARGNENGQKHSFEGDAVSAAKVLVLKRRSRYDDEFPAFILASGRWEGGWKSTIATLFIQSDHKQV